jgi:hypothetical protein
MRKVNVLEFVSNQTQGWGTPSGDGAQKDR